MRRVREPRQERSSRTERALGEAADALIQERSLDKIPVAEIAGRAGVSIGAFYARFECKEALLDWLCRDRLRRAGEEVRQEMLRLEAEGADLATLVEAYVNRVAAFYRDHVPLLREVLRLGYGETPEPVLRETAEVNADVDRELVQVLLRRREEIGHPDPEYAAAFVPTFVAAALARRLVFAAGTETKTPDQSVDRLTRELVHWILSALTTPAP